MPHLPCPAPLWPAFSRLLDEAMELSAEEQRQWLAALGPEHAELLPWLEKVLLPIQRPQTSRFMSAPATVPASDTDEFKPGQCIGPYELERLLGRGGMGEVWLAIRSDRTPNRRVALKLPHAFLLAGVQRRRFERERDILAALSHPNIAPLYDAGVAEDRHPYLAMEWVDGLPIHQWCRAHALSVDARLVLFRQVLDAVGQAHAQFIAHRDLKPSNMLVTQSGQVKLLDFGIAKLLDGERSGDATELTRVGGRTATPDYAAPEQLAGEPLTTAVDVYALGVVLHELLTGRRPPPAAPGAPAALRLPSASIDEAHAVAVGGLTPAALRKALSGDLDAILVKALEHDPARRYRSVEALADDLARAREHRPISARRIGPLALGLRFVRRHRLGVALGAALAVALVAGTAGVAWQALRAERSAQRATQIKDFLVGMFRDSDPSIAAEAPRTTITAKELIDLNASRIERDFTNDPVIAIDLLGVLSSIYAALDDTERYTQLHARYVALALQHYGPLHPVVLGALLEDADAALRYGDGSDAERTLADVDSRLRKAGLEHSQLRATWWRLQAQLLKTRADGLDGQRQALDAAIALLESLGLKNNDLLGALIERAQLSFNALQPTEAERYFRRALSVGKALQPPNDGQVQRVYSGLAQALSYQGRADEARPLLEASAALALRTFGEQHWHYWETTAQQARLLHQQGDSTAAAALFERLLPSLPENGSGNADSRRTAQVVRVLYARCLVDEGMAGRAAQLLAEDAASAGSDLSGLRLRFAYAETQLALGHNDRAEQQLAAIADGLQQLLPDNNAERLLVQVRLADAQAGLGRRDLARQSYLQVLERSARHGMAAMRAYAGLATLDLQTKQPREALQSVRDAMKALQGSTGIVSVRLQPGLQRLEAEALMAGGQIAQAQQTAQAALGALERYDREGSTELLQTRQLMRRLAQHAHGAAGSAGGDSSAAAAPAIDS